MGRLIISDSFEYFSFIVGFSPNDPNFPRQNRLEKEKIVNAICDLIYLIFLFQVL